MSWIRCSNVIQILKKSSDDCLKFVKSDVIFDIALKNAFIIANRSGGNPEVLSGRPQQWRGTWGPLLSVGSGKPPGCGGLWDPKQLGVPPVAGVSSIASHQKVGS